MQARRTSRKPKKALTKLLCNSFLLVYIGILCRDFRQASYELTQALVLCKLNNFKAGILFLYEKAKL